MIYTKSLECSILLILVLAQDRGKYRGFWPQYILGNFKRGTSLMVKNLIEGDISLPIKDDSKPSVIMFQHILPDLFLYYQLFHTFCDWFYQKHVSVSTCILEVILIRNFC